MNDLDLYEMANDMYKELDPCCCGSTDISLDDNGYQYWYECKSCNRASCSVDYYKDIKNLPRMWNQAQADFAKEMEYENSQT